MKADLIIHNARLITCAYGGKPKRLSEMRDVGLVENGAVAVKDGRIAAVGKSAAILREFESQTTIDAGGQTVSPGFVECHTHIVFAGNRLDEFELKIKGADYLEILKSGGGILSTVRQTRQASFDELVEQSRRRLDKLLALGVTTCEVKTGYGLETETELKMLEAVFQLDQTHEIDLIPTFLAAHAVPPEYADVPGSKFQVPNSNSELSTLDSQLSTPDSQPVNRSDEYIDLICGEMLPLVKSRFQSSDLNPQIFVDVFCEKNAFDLAQSRRVLETAKALGFGLKAHVDEFTNLGGAQMAIELGAVSIDHLDAISAPEIKLLAGSKTIGVVTPTVNFNFGSRDFADARRLIDAGCAVALSTDYNPGSAPCPSLPNAMAIACRYQKLLPSEVFNAATINAAFAVGRGDQTGSLEPGKAADMLIFETSDYREIAYEFGGNLVEKVIKNGALIQFPKR